MGITILASNHDNLSLFPKSLCVADAAFVELDSCLISCKLAFLFHFMINSVFIILLFYLACICIHSKVRVCIRADSLLLDTEVHYLHNTFNRFFFFKELHCKRKNLKIKGLVQCSRTDEERRSRRWRACQRPHPTRIEFHSPISLPSSLLRALSPSFICFFLPWTIFYIQCNILRT